MTDNQQLTEAQQALLKKVTEEINRELLYWPRQSGKTFIRQQLAAQILKDDK